MNKQQLTILALCLTLVGSETIITAEEEGLPKEVLTASLGPSFTHPVQESDQQDPANMESHESISLIPLFPASSRKTEMMAEEDLPKEVLAATVGPSFTHPVLESDQQNPANKQSHESIPLIPLFPASTRKIEDADGREAKGNQAKVDDSTAGALEDIHPPTAPPFGTFPPTTPFWRCNTQGSRARSEVLHSSEVDDQLTERTIAGSSEELGEGECHTEATQEEMHQIGDAMMKFGLDLYRIIRLKTTKPNVVLSPLSIALGLSQLALGAANDTEKLLMKALHVESVHCFHDTLQRIQQELTKTALSIATQIYMKKGFPVKPKFLKQSRRFYGSRPMTLAGNSDSDLKAVNQWVEKATGGKIKALMSQFPKDMLLLLINAIHFKGLWKNMFDPRFTSTGIFNLDEHHYVPVEMMNSPKYPLSWYLDEELKAQVARFPFKDNMSLIIFLPFSGEPDISRFSSLNVTEIYNKLPKERPIYVKLPKLNLDSDLDLNQPLIQLGLGQLFTSPDLRKISDGALFVSSVMHKSTLELKEEGVEASAATSIAMSRSLITFSVNQPFLFLLLDDVTGIPLFLGSVTNPAPQAEKLVKEKLGITEHRFHKDHGHKPK